MSFPYNSQLCMGLAVGHCADGCQKGNWAGLINRGHVLDQRVRVRPSRHPLISIKEKRSSAQTTFPQCLLTRKPTKDSYCVADAYGKQTHNPFRRSRDTLRLQRGGKVVEVFEHHSYRAVRMLVFTRSSKYTGELRVKCELFSLELVSLLGAIAQHSKTEERLRILISRTAEGYVLSMHTAPQDEPPIMST